MSLNAVSECRGEDQNLQLEWVHSTVPGYETAASGDPEVFPITQPILYRAGAFAVVEQGFFFFSGTPDRIYSEQWDGGYPYFCSWARFRREGEGGEFYVFNVHNDFRSRDNRLRTSELIADRIGTIVRGEAPVIVLGDFNAPKGFRELALLEAIGLRVVPPGGATNRVLGLHLLPAIDHVLVSEGITTRSGVTVWRERYDGVYPADHYPISVDIAF